MKKNKALAKAEKIISDLKKDLLDILYEADYSYGSMRDFLYFIEEDTIYDLKKLNLNVDIENYYIRKVIDLFGPYSETNQLYGKKDPYYGNFYFEQENQKNNTSKSQ